MRDPGFYWVCLEGRLVVAEFYPQDNCWLVTGSPQPFNDDNFDFVDNRPLFYDHKHDEDLEIGQPFFADRSKKYFQMRKVFHKHLQNRK